MRSQSQLRNDKYIMIKNCLKTKTSCVKITIVSELFERRNFATSDSAVGDGRSCILLQDKSIKIQVYTGKNSVFHTMQELC